MPNVDHFDVLKGLRAAFLADAPTLAVLGNPPRIHDAVPKLVVFPWAKITFTEVEPLRGTMKLGAAGIDWIPQYRAEIIVNTKERSQANVAAIAKVIADVMDNLPTKLTINGGSAKCFQSLRGAPAVGYDTETQNAFAFQVWTFAVDPDP